MDLLGHVNNTVYFRYIEQARIEWIFATAPGGRGVLRHGAGDRQRELHVPRAARLSGRHRGQDVPRRSRAHQRRQLLRNPDERPEVCRRRREDRVDRSRDRPPRAAPRARSRRRCARSSGPRSPLPADAADNRARTQERGHDRNRTALATVARAHRAGEHHRIRAPGRGGVGPAAARLRGALALVERRARGVLARGLGLRGHHRDPRRAHARRPGADAGREVVSRRAPQFRREPARAAAGGRHRRCAGVPRRGQARCAMYRMRSSSRVRRRWPLRSGRGASGRAIASPRTCRTCPRPSSRCSARRASGPSGRRARRISVCRACSIASARSSRACSSPSMATGTTARRSRSATRSRRSSARLPTVEHVVVVPYLEQSGHGSRRRDPDTRCHRLGSVHRRARGGRERIRPAAVRPSAVHPLFVRHDGRAQVHRPRRRRDVAPAHEGAPAARRRQGRRSPVLFHDLRLDDVELARVGARRRRHAAALRRLAVRRPRQGALGLRRGRADHALRHLGQVHRPCEEARRRPAQGLRARALADALLDRQPARAGKLRLRLPVRQGRPLPVVDRRRHRHRLLLRARVSDAAGVARRAAVPRPRDAGRRVRRRRQAGSRRQGAAGRARLHGALSVDADRLLERPGRRRNTGPPISSAFPACGVTATTWS